jgi:hypothetical protein
MSAPWSWSWFTSKSSTPSQSDRQENGDEQDFTPGTFPPPIHSAIMGCEDGANSTSSTYGEHTDLVFGAGVPMAALRSEGE